MGRWNCQLRNSLSVNLLIVGNQRCDNNDLLWKKDWRECPLLDNDREIGATSALHMLNCVTICFETWDKPKPQDSGWNTQSRWQPLHKHKSQSHSESQGCRTEIWNYFRCDRATQRVELYLGWCQQVLAKQNIARMAILLRLCEPLHLIIQKKKLAKS